MLTMWRQVTLNDVTWIISQEIEEKPSVKFDIGAGCLNKQFYSFYSFLTRYHTSETNENSRHDIHEPID